MPVPHGPGPHTYTAKVGPWRLHLHAHQGKVRDRIEDAWAHAAGARMGRHTVDTFAVFDGLGGVPNGQEAAWAAADGLTTALERADGPDALLDHLNDSARRTGGSTTAALLLLARGDPARGWMLTIGDSSIYRRDGDRLERLNPHDRIERHKLTDWLGRPRIGGHLRELALRPDDVFVLCTDGADEIAGLEAVAAVAQAPPDQTAAALRQLFARVLDAGAPDNATVMVVRRGQPF